MKKSKTQIQADLHLATEPDDAFMSLLSEVGDTDVIAGPRLGDDVRSYTGEEIET
jgi:hypothetical protein